MNNELKNVLLIHYSYVFYNLSINQYKAVIR